MDSAEKLRTAVVDAARDECLAYTESAGSYLGDRMAWDEDVGVYGPAACVLRAIVEELGLDLGRVHTLNHVADVIDAEHGGSGNGYAIAIREAAAALSTLLHAAGFTPTEDPR